MAGIEYPVPCAAQLRRIAYDAKNGLTRHTHIAKQARFSSKDSRVQLTWKNMRDRTIVGGILLSAIVATAGPAYTQVYPASSVEAGAAYVAINLMPAKYAQKLKVSSPAFVNGGDVPFENTGFRGNIFPGLLWSKGPRGTRSYVAVLQDADALFKDGVVLHWTMYNIPADVTSLAPGMTNPPPGAFAGPNRDGTSQGYLGPRTGPGRKHHYPYQIFALDREITSDPALTWDGLKAAMKGHVLASGQTVGLGQIDPTAPPGPPLKH